VTSPSQLVANTDNYNITLSASGDTWAELSSDATRNLTGIVCPSTGVIDGHRLTIFNKGAQTIAIVGDSANSTAANRIYGPNAGGLNLGPKEGCILRYSSSLTHWCIVAYSV
jgi:hypothetical protein